MNKHTLRWTNKMTNKATFIGTIRESNINLIKRIIKDIIKNHDTTKNFNQNLKLLKYTPIVNNYHNYINKRFKNIIGFIDKQELLEMSIKMNLNGSRINYLSDEYFLGNQYDCIDAMADYIYDPTPEEVKLNIYFKSKF